MLKLRKSLLSQLRPAVLEALCGARLLLHCYIEQVRSFRVTRVFRVPPTARLRAAANNYIV